MTLLSRLLNFKKVFLSNKIGFTEVQKSQKNLNDNFSQFKMTAQGQFMTINEVLESRSQISQGKSSAANEELNDIKKTIKQLKSFVTQSTRQQHQAQQIRDNQHEKSNKQFLQQIKSLHQKNQQSTSQITQLQHQLQQLSVESAKRTQISDLRFDLQKQSLKISELHSFITQIDKVLTNTKVEQFKSIIDDMNQTTTKQLAQMKTKISLKSTVTDLLKLEEMILNVTEYAFAEVYKIMAVKQQTKKALVFLEKRINSLIVMIVGENEDEREGLLTSKQLKCISCTKDLGQVQGKLDKAKNWSVFPVKETLIKQKYGGFGAGFQTILQSSIVKKGGQVKYDQKGRMVEPFNLTGTIQGSLMKSSRSQHKIQQSDSKSKLGNMSPNKSSLKYQTSFMHQFGKESSQQNGISISITEEYYNRFRGLESFVMGNKKNQQKDIGTTK